MKPIPGMYGNERTEFYRSQLFLALSDGGISRDERRLLDVSRKRLGIAPQAARELERDATGPNQRRAGS